MSALAFAPASPIYPDGLVVSGGRDATVRLWNPVRFTELQILEGHKYQVGGGGWVCRPGSWGRLHSHRSWLILRITAVILQTCVLIFFSLSLCSCLGSD